MCNTRAAVDKVSWLGLVRLDSRKHWPTPALQRSIFFAAIEQSPPPIQCTALHVPAVATVSGIKRTSRIIQLML